MPSFYVGDVDLSSGSRASVTGTLPAEPSTHPLFFVCLFPFRKIASEMFSFIQF